MNDTAARILYRAPTDEAPATVTLSDGSEVAGLLHLHGDASAPGGFESVQHLLDDEPPFFAVTLESGQVALVGKGSVVEVRCALPVAEALPGTTAHRLEVVLSTGATLRGTTFWSAPPAHVRVIDVLNGSRFLRVDTDAGSVYVNTTHIRVAHPMD